MAGREGKRGECQTRLGLVWRETGAVRNARPSRGQAASTRKRAPWRKCWRSLPFEVSWGVTDDRNFGANQVGLRVSDKSEGADSQL